MIIYLFLLPDLYSIGFTLAMGTSDIEAAINSTNQRKEDLRQAFEFLQSHSSSIISFSLQWKDIEDHFSSIEKSITERFNELKELDLSSVAEKHASAPLSVKVEQTEKKPLAVKFEQTEKKPQALKVEQTQEKAEEIKPRLELKDLCRKMDAEGLFSFITGNRNTIVAIRDEIRPAILSAPDPVSLILNSIDQFDPSQKTTAAELRSNRMTCISILECLNVSALEISQQSMDRAMEVALKWKGLITDGKGVNGTVVLSFLVLVAAFGLVESFEADYILDLIATVGMKRSIMDLCRSSAFEGKMPDLIEKLINSGKQLDAIRFVVAFNLSSKYPPAALLKAYLKQAKTNAHEVRVKGNNSFDSQNQATLKEIDALRAAIKTVEECNLGSLYQIEPLQKRIEQLEKQRTEIKQRKRGLAPANASNSNNGKYPKQLHKKPPSKRPRTSNSSVPAVSAQHQARNPAHPSEHNPTHLPAHNPPHPPPHNPPHPPPHNPPHPPAHNPVHPLEQIGAGDRIPYGDFTGSYSWGAGQSLHNHGRSSFAGDYVGLGGSHALPRSYINPSESIAASGYYDRAATTGPYSKIGVPAYNPSAYSSSFNPSLYH